MASLPRNRAPSCDNSSVWVYRLKLKNFLTNNFSSGFLYVSIAKEILSSVAKYLHELVLKTCA